jgi:tripartite-type tricarboxylate transporter receptor subunit TctC
MKRLQRFLAASVALLMAGSAAMAQDYPHRPIRLIVPYPAGGITDVLGRLYAQQLSATLGQPVITENRTGQAGSIGIDHVAKSAPDGYTLGFSANGPLASNYALFKSLSYHPGADLAPVARLGFIQNILAVHPSVPAQNLSELLALLRANPGKYSFASGGNGTAQHFSGELLKSMAKVEMAHVPYRGEAQSINDVLGGQVPLLFGSLPSTLPHIQAGRLRALAVSGGARSPLLPDVPTIGETVPGYNGTLWVGLFAPEGVPGPVLAQLQDGMARALAASDLRSKLEASGVEMAGPADRPVAPAQMAALLREDIARWARIVKASGASLD